MMPVTHFIGKHLDESLIQYQFLTSDKPVGCTMCGAQVMRFCQAKDVFQESFLEYSYIRRNLQYVCINCTKSVGKIRNAEGKESFLRCYSFLATKSTLNILRREDVLSLVEKPPAPPFVLCVTYSFKKHMAFKARVQTQRDRFIVTTDRYDVVIDKTVVNDILGTMKQWYTVVPGSKQERTFFTKEEILHSSTDFGKIEAYGFHKFFEQDKMLDKHRGTALMEFLTHILNKSTKTCGMI